MNRRGFMRALVALPAAAAALFAARGTTLGPAQIRYAKKVMLEAPMVWVDYEPIDIEGPMKAEIGRRAAEAWDRAFAEQMLAEHPWST